MTWGAPGSSLFASISANVLAKPHSARLKPGPPRAASIIANEIVHAHIP